MAKEKRLRIYEVSKWITRIHAHVCLAPVQREYHFRVLMSSFINNGKSRKN